MLPVRVRTRTAECAAEQPCCGQSAHSRGKRPRDEERAGYGCRQPIREQLLHSEIQIALRLTRSCN